MKKLKKKYIDALESLDWSVSSYTDDGRVELETFSPAGEDFSICVDVEDFPDSVAKCAEDFDQDEHIALWIMARNNGASGVPSTRELVKNPEAIEEMLQDLASALREAEDITDLSDCDESLKEEILENAEKLNRKENEKLAGRESFKHSRMEAL